MDKGALTALIFLVVPIIFGIGAYLHHKRQGTLHLLTLSHLPPIVRRLVWYGLVPGVFLIAVLFVLFGF